MSEDTVVQSNLEALKARADVLGLSYHPSIGEAKLQEKVNEALAEKPAANDAVSGAASVGADSEHSDAKASANETDTQKRQRKQKEASELIRVQVTSMDPNKREYDGEIFCAGNRVIGTFKKYVPFDVEYHVPRVIYNMIKGKMCQVFVTKRDDKGRQIREGKLIKAYNVTVLDPLTQTELDDLAQRQAMSRGTSAA